MEEQIELKDPEHPEAKAAAEATARLLIEVHRKRQELVQTEVVPTSICFAVDLSHANEDSTINVS